MVVALLKIEKVVSRNAVWIRNNIPMRGLP